MAKAVAVAVAAAGSAVAEVVVVAEIVAVTGMCHCWWCDVVACIVDKAY